MNGFLQAIVSIWIGVHPVTITLPKLYARTDQGECFSHADAVVKSLKRHERGHYRFEAWCEETDKRDL
jgi:hypothetical protein